MGQPVALDHLPKERLRRFLPDDLIEEHSLVYCRLYQPESEKEKMIYGESPATVRYMATLLCFRAVLNY